jgi:hypothetical protein
MVVVMNIEQTFGITIPDEEAVNICNMGQLYDYVLARVGRGRAQACVTSAAFYRLRRTLGEVCGVPRERVRTQTQLEDLMPIHDRPRYWQELRARLSNLHLPPLRRPRWLEKRIGYASVVPLFLCILCTMVLVGVLGETPAGAAVFCFALFACPVVGTGGLFLVTHAVHIPVTCASVQDTIYTLISQHPAPPMVSDISRPTDKEIWGTLCAIVGDELDRVPASYTKDTKFT